jgi:hypothetical protein
MGDAHHLNEIIIRAHWRVDAEDGVGRDNLERRLDAPLDLLPIKPSSPSRARSPQGARSTPSHLGGVLTASAVAPSAHGTRR